MKLLLIEDDPATAQAIELMLMSEGFNVECTDLGAEVMSLSRTNGYDLILLDINLPDISGFEVLHRLRTERIPAPIIILSGLAAIEDKVKGLDLGADDYMTKPFHKNELVARIRAVTRRSNGHARSVIEAGNMTLNLNIKHVEVAGKGVRLTGREYGLLEALALRKGVSITRDAMLESLYNERDEPEPKIIDVFICKLRKKLAAAGMLGVHIETIWGSGFALVEDARDAL